MRFLWQFDPYLRPLAEPPRTLGRFYWWCLRGCMPVISAGAIVSMLAGTLEVYTALLLGVVIDKAIATEPARLFSESSLLLIGSVAFFMILRPIIFGLSSLFSSVLIAPNVGTMVLSRLHRHTMEQSISFFDGNCSGRRIVV